MGGYISSILTRACGGLRVVLISSNSPSGYPTVYSRCTGGSSQVGMVRGRGNNISSTHGTNLTVTGNR